MIWLEEEGKQELSVNATKNVYELEQRCQTFQKDCKQKQFQMDSLQAALGKQKRLTDDENANSSFLKKENNFVAKSTQELGQNREETFHDLNAKEAQIRCLELRLTNVLDNLQHDHNQFVEKVEKQTADLTESNDANNQLQRQLADHKERVEALESQLKRLREEPDSREQKSSSGFESEMEWEFNQEKNLKEIEANLQMEREQCQKIGKELLELNANSLKVSNKVSMPSTSEIKDITVQQELKYKTSELALATEKLEAKDSEMKETLREMSEMSECLYKKEHDIKEMSTKLSEIYKIKSQPNEANTNIEALEQEKETLGGRLHELTTHCELVENMKDALNEAEKELAGLRAERQDTDKWLERERQKIVEAAREFALQQEQTFNNEVGILEYKLTCKDKELQEMESLLNQLRHNLKSLQQEKNVLLEAAEERDREFEEEKKLWNSGIYSNGKIQQYISDLNEERLNVSHLKEKCNGLESRMKELEDVNSSLRKDLGRIREEKKLETEGREEALSHKVDFLRSESTKLEEKLQTKESLVLGLMDERNELSMTVASLGEELSKSAQVVTELQQQCDYMKEQLENLREEKGRLEQEKDASMMQEKFYTEISVKKVRELEVKLGKEVKEKKELSNIVEEMRGILEKEKNCLKEKNQELAEVKRLLQLAVKENEESIKDKKTNLVELTFSYKDLKSKLDKTEKNFEEKCKELKQVKDLKSKLDKTEKNFEEKCKELKQVKEQLNQTESEVKKWKTIAHQRKAFATNLKLANKLEKLSWDKNAASPCTDNAGAGKSSHGSSSSKPSGVSFVKGDVLLSPLAKSLSNLEIKSPTTVTIQAAATRETSSASTSRTQRQTISTKESLPLEERVTDVYVEANKRGIYKPNGSVDTKKRAGQQASDVRMAKRRHVSSGNEADRQTTSTAVKTRSAAMKVVQPTFTKDGAESHVYTCVPPRGQFFPPEMPLSPRKTKSVNIPQGPRPKIPKPGRSQLPRHNNQKMPSASTQQDKSRRRQALGETASKSTGNQTECKMQ